MDIFPHRLTQNAKSALVAADAAARETGAAHVTTLHLLAAIARRRGSAGAHLLSTIGIQADLLAAAGTPTAATVTRTVPTLSTDLRETILGAYTIAQRTGYTYVGTEHLVYAAVAHKNPAVDNLLGNERIAALTAASAARNPMSEQFSRQMSHLLDAIHGSDAANEQQEAPRDIASGADDESALEHFTTDLGADADDRALVGRDDIVNRIITILSRREKSNPLLVGAPGVGKTAIVEGLAQRIRSGRVPAHLLDAHIRVLDMAHLIAGTTFRGEFEARLKDVIADAQDDPRVILFIDELHTIVGAGNAQGSLDAANILKPALSRGELRVIGATTDAEYRKHFAKDGALARRFQVVHLPEPDRDATIAILQGNRAHYEAFHNVHIDAALIPQIVDWSIRYLPDRRLPDKAFDILDEASATARLDRDDEALRRHVLLERDYDEAVRRKNDAIATERYDDALALRAEEVRLDAALTAQRSVVARSMAPVAVTATHAATATAHLAKIPVSHVTRTAAAAAAAALDTWRAAVVGQDEATTQIAATLLRSAAGVAHPDRPQGSFLLLGPVGVGKTHAAQTLAHALTGRADALLRLDMSEFGDRHTVARLLGAPAGYVGYGSGSTLTEHVRRIPNAVILFDEIEKAHPDVLNILLQILDTGTLTDAEGERADFRNTVVILTSNIGTEAMTRRDALGFANDTAARDAAAARETALREVRRAVRAEILDRLDHIIVFRPLDAAALTTIAKRGLVDLRDRLRHTRRVRLQIGATVAATIARSVATDGTSGARAIRRALRDQIENPVAALLATVTPAAPTIRVTAAKGVVSVRSDA